MASSSAPSTPHPVTVFFLVKMELCVFFLVTKDVLERMHSHVTGKQHIGYGLVRDFLVEYKIIGSRQLPATIVVDPQPQTPPQPHNGRGVRGFLHGTPMGSSCSHGACQHVDMEEQVQHPYWPLPPLQRVDEALLAYPRPAVFYIPGGICAIRRLSHEHACAGTGAVLPAHQGQQRAAAGAGRRMAVVARAPQYASYPQSWIDNWFKAARAAPSDHGLEILLQNHAPAGGVRGLLVGTPPWSAAAAMERVNIPLSGFRSKGQHPSWPLPSLQQPTCCMSLNAWREALDYSSEARMG